MGYDDLIYLLPVVFVAYFAKATTGFGSAIILMSVGSIVIGPVEALILTTILDAFGGLALLRLDTTKDTRKHWLPLCVAMVAGVALGGILLKVFVIRHVDYLIAFALLSVGLWLVFVRSRYSNATLQADLPEDFTTKDLLVCLIAGVCGGVSGLSGAPVVFYFGRRFGKEAFRRILTRIFLAEAAARFVVLVALGLTSTRSLVISLVCVPIMFLGLLAGNRAFFKTSETWYSRATGAISVIAALRILLR